MTRRTTLLLALGPVLFLGWFFAWPIVSILTTAWRGPVPAGRLLDPGVIWFTVWQAAVSTILTVAAGLPIAGVIARFSFPGRNLLRTLTIIPFVLPSLVVGVAFLALIGPGGAVGVDLTGTATAIVLAHVFFNVAIVVRLVGTMWANLDPATTDAARSLGASPWQAFRTITLPHLAPAVSAAAAVVFLFCFTSFGTVLVLGGPRLATIEVEIYRRSALLFDLRGAAVLALIQMAGVIGALLLYARHRGRSRQGISLRTARLRRPGTRRERLLVAAVGVWTLGLAGIPVLALVVRAFTAGGSVDLSPVTALATSPLVDVGGAIGSSLGYALAATLFAVGIGLPAAVVIASRRGRLAAGFDTLLMLPLGTSAVTLGFGMLIALDAPIDLRRSWILVPVAHALVAIPFVVRSIAPVLAAIRRQVREAAAVLGASPARVRREIDLPIATRAAAVGAGFAFAVSLGEFGATTFLARPGAPTLPLAIFRLLGRPGALNLRGAMVLAVALMALTAAVVLLVDRIRLPGRDLF